MVCHEEAASTLVPGMSSLDNSTLGLYDEAFGNDLRPPGLLRVLPSAGSAVAREAHDLHAGAVGLLEGHGAFAAAGGIGAELLQPRDFDVGLGHDVCGRVPVLHARCGDRDGRQQIKRGILRRYGTG